MIRVLRADPIYDDGTVMNGSTQSCEWLRACGVPHSSQLHRDGWGSGLFAAGPGPVGFDFDGANFSGGPVVEAAPWPVFRLLDETASDGIAVGVEFSFSTHFA